MFGDILVKNLVCSEGLGTIKVLESVPENTNCCRLYEDALVLAKFDAECSAVAETLKGYVHTWNRKNPSLRVALPDTFQVAMCAVHNGVSLFEVSTGIRFCEAVLAVNVHGKFDYTVFRLLVERGNALKYLYSFLCFLEHGWAESALQINKKA